MARILVIDDQPRTLELLSNLFTSAGHVVDVAADGLQARTCMEDVDYDVVFSDLRLGYPYDGLEMLEMIKKLRPRTQVVMMTAFRSVESSVLAMKAGAYDYITKPFKAEDVLVLAQRAAEKAQRAVQVEQAGAEPGTEGSSTPEIVGRSATMVRLMRLVGQVARTEATVLVVGESGTGKELVAKAIHQLSPRSDKPFVAVNCGAIPENLQESEFFGHVKGAFTGAIRNKMGLFEQAHGGTLFLDEVGETSLSTQVKLLRFLQTGEVRRVGGNESAQVNVRLVTATNRDLESMIRAKLFREDLYYRLNIIAVEAPPLRERDGDIPVLAGYFLKKVARKLGNGVTGYTPAAMTQLQAYHWPGNVRQLENAVERAVTLARGSLVDVEDLPPLDRPSGRVTAGGAPATTLLAPIRSSGEWELPAPPVSPDRAAVAGSPTSALVVEELARFPSLRDMERRHIEMALAHFGGNRARTCEALGISKATLWRKLKAYGLSS